MFSGPTQTEPYTALPFHQRGVTRSNDHSAALYGVTPRQVVGLPPPLEPRTSHPLQPAFPDPATTQPRRETYAGIPAAPRPEGRPHGHSLPRLHDILTSAAPAASPVHAPYSSGWSSSAAPSINNPPPRADAFLPHAGLHPPLVFPPPPQLPPSSAIASSYPPPPAPSSLPGRRLDLPTLETHAAVREAIPPTQRSPLPVHTPEARSDYGDGYYAGARQLPTNPYHARRVPSPYTPASTEDALYRSPIANYDWSSAGPYGPAGPESQRKYLGIREIPGEGTFHLYEGGFRIPTHVDGEQVNPAWGLTKANKPRKRLAMACLDCREKKIKCEPGVNSCLQCEKAKRPCRKYVAFGYGVEQGLSSDLRDRAPLHQPQNESGPTPSWQSCGTPPARRDSSDPTHSHFRSAEADLMQKRRTREEHSPSRIPAKKHRSASPVFANFDGADAPRSGAGHIHALASANPPSPGSPKTFAWDEDPFAVDPDLTIHLIQLYFANVNSMTYDIFPRQHFMHWLKSHSRKGPNERMVLYAMLAVGTIFADDSLAGCGQHCADIAINAIRSQIGHSNLPIVQARLIISVWSFSKGPTEMAWDYSKLAASAAVFQRYDTEQGCSDVGDGTAETRMEFGFTPEQLIECRRRTMWSVFLIDRYCGAPTCQIDPGNVFVRLPCLDELYERGIRSDAPLFSDAEMGRPDSPLSANSPVSTTGWLLFVAAICGNVVNFVHRAPHRPTRVYKEAYERFYDDTHLALRDWTSRLPEFLRFSPANVERSVEGGYAGPFTAMHILHHYAAMKLNRFVRHSLIPDVASRNIRATHYHAHALLEVMSSLRSVKQDTGPDGRHSAPFAFTLPFAGHAILSAIDVVSAGGLDSNLGSTIQTIGGGLDYLRELARTWASAYEDSKACEKRYYQIQNVLKHPFTARGGCWLGREWGLTTPLERDFGRQDDCIYGVSDRVYFDAFKEEHARSPSPPAPASATPHHAHHYHHQRPSTTSAS